MVGAWNLTKGVSIDKIGEDNLFRFEHTTENQRTYWRSPWAFDRNLVILREIQKDEDPMDVNLNVCNFYVHVRGLPVIGATEV